MLQKSSNFVIDASVVIAYIQEEVGQEVAAHYIEELATISAVNFSEVLYAGYKNGYKELQRQELFNLLPNIAVFDADQASLAASLYPFTKQYGLSFADRACLALAKSMGAPVVTADKIWQGIDIGVEIIVIR
jgi:ribonuclease VapC